MKEQETFSGVKEISISRMNKGYNIKIGGREEVELPDASNFEWRIAEGCSPSLNHMYFGNETGDEHEFNFHIDFNEPCDVRITNGHPRCYVHVAPSK